MCHAVLCVLSLAYAVAPGATTQAAPADARVLATVRIPVIVGAGEGTLMPGTYELRLTGQRPAPLPGQPTNAQEWVELVADGRVVAREAAEVLYDDDLTSIGASAEPVRRGTRVELLKSGEFVRISVKRDRDRYLIYLPVRQ